MRTRVLAPLAIVTLAIVCGLVPQVRAAQPSGTKTFDPTTTDTEAAIKAAADAAREAAAQRGQPVRATPNADR